MKRYIGIKEINATPMDRGEYNALRGWVVPADECITDQGYLVEYIDGGQRNHPQFDGYISWSPKDVFERAYRETAGMTFGLAIEALKRGERVARAGWNGKGMFVYYVPPASYPAQTGVAKAYFGADALVPYEGYLAIKNVSNTVSTWVPSINDVLAEDWVIA